MYDVFISHSSRDKEEIVNDLSFELSQLGLDVWIDKNEIIAGDNIQRKIKEGIEHSSSIVLILTKSFFESLWSSLELGLATSNTLQIIPVLIDIPIELIARKFPFLLTLKYIQADDFHAKPVALEICNNVMEIKHRTAAQETIYQRTVRRINNADTPSLNKVAILLSEYEQLCKISVLTGVKHAAQIGYVIINDIFKQEHLSMDGVTDFHSNLEFLLHHNVGLNQNILEHFDFVLSTHGGSPWPAFSNETGYKHMMDLSIAAVVDWYITYVQSNLGYALDSEAFEIVGTNGLRYSDFLDMYKIDQLVLRSDLIAPPEIAYEWYKYNYYTHIAVRSLKIGKVVGYIALLPVTEELFDQIKNGDFKDNDLTTKNIRQYDIPDFYKLYAACIAIHPQYQNTLAFNKLYNGMIRMFYSLATEREVYITDIITEPHANSLSLRS